MDDIPALIKRLEAGLEGVTPGPWYSEGTAVFFDTRKLACCGKGTFECCGNPDIDGDYGPVAETSETGARHIANCDPDTIRTLLSALQAQAAEIIETRSELIETRAALEKAVMEVGKWAGKFGRQETLTAAAEAKLREAVEEFNVIVKYHEEADSHKTAADYYYDIARAFLATMEKPHE